jgi:hypothetical protein
MAVKRTGPASGGDSVLEVRSPDGDQSRLPDADASLLHPPPNPRHPETRRASSRRIPPNNFLLRLFRGPTAAPLRNDDPTIETMRMPLREPPPTLLHIYSLDLPLSGTLSRNKGYVFV